MNRRVLSVTSEYVPLVKTGGLADVAGALPSALAEHDWDMRTLLPAYPGLIARLGDVTQVWADDALFGGQARVLMGRLDAATVLLLNAPHLYDRDGGPYGNPHDFADNPQRFAALSWVAAQIAQSGTSDGWTPEIVHCHDWQAGFAPAYMALCLPSAARSVITIHNIAFKGEAPAAMLGSLRLPIEAFNSDSLEYWGNLSSLKAGLVHADAITTVSPTYAEELMRPQYGFGLEGLLKHRAADFHGILNGVDETQWNPETDPHIARHFNKSTLAHKQHNRTALMAEFGLVACDGPCAIVVSRLTDQKGMDLLVEAIPDFLQAGGCLAVLGSGDPHIEQDLKSLAQSNPGRVGLRIGYDEALSHRMFAGGDLVLVPSRFEPCGLTQLYGLRYGCVPVVALTGGLADTVINATPMALQDKSATGIQFHPVDALAFGQALRRAVSLHQNKKTWTAVQKKGMSQVLGWGASAASYADLYESLIV
ncbi:glycogen synthase GlgA [Loktanella sp. SALINAS62]|uniref:glycogen synthase GlgA n=1 Tax=Loktanella sp. SALINAS62 TaxID=2706124 RepID=UPI001B8B30B1|nr:glycogen synthase GlgA [Loktanella sp. SALINAS62]MBS1300762.1 glycogen synthase GlgA [Loktanella sp. SALINAS62]